MARYTFVVNAVISMHVDVDAATMDEAIEEAQAASVMTLCHQCARGDKGCWNTSGELDTEPASAELVEVLVDGEMVTAYELLDVEARWAGEDA